MNYHPFKMVVNEIEVLYDKLPSVNCIGCGECCVSPTCTLVEFIYLMKNLDTCLTRQQKEHFLRAPVEPDKRYDGNIKCALISSNRCSVHLIRTGACRLFGMPAIESMKIPDLVRCKNGTKHHPSHEENAFVKNWLKKLVVLNRRLYPMGEPPYFLTGLSLECWLDILFYRTWKQPFFRNLHDVLTTLTNFVNSGQYELRTGIVEKIAVIDEFSDNIDCGDGKKLNDMLLRIRDGFPLTGTWFYEEANVYLNHIVAFHECSEPTLV